MSTGQPTFHAPERKVKTMEEKEEERTDLKRNIAEDSAKMEEILNKLGRGLRYDDPDYNEYTGLKINLEGWERALKKLEQ